MPRWALGGVNGAIRRIVRAAAPPTCSANRMTESEDPTTRPPSESPGNSPEGVSVPESMAADAQMYNELRRLAQYYMVGQNPGHTLTATALVHEAFIRLTGPGTYKDRTHVVAVAARTMRSILVDHARRNLAIKRSPRGTRVSVDLLLDPQADPDTALELDECLQKLEAFDADLAMLLELRSYGGLSDFEIATATGRSLRSVQRHLSIARAWLAKELE